METTHAIQSNRRYRFKIGLWNDRGAGHPLPLEMTYVTLTDSVETARAVLKRLMEDHPNELDRIIVVQG